MKVGDVRYRVRKGFQEPVLYSSTIIKVSAKMAYVDRHDSDAFDFRQQLPLADAEELTAATPRGAWLKYGMEQQAIIDKLEKKMAEARKQQEIARAKADEAAMEASDEPA